MASVAALAQAPTVIQGTDVLSTSRAVINQNFAALYAQAPLNAVAYGADPSGVTDTSAQIENAIHAACVTPAKPLYFPPGVYQWKRHITASGCDLIITGGYSSAVTFLTTGVSTALTTVGNLAHFEGFTWRQSDTIATQFINSTRSGGGLTFRMNDVTLVSSSISPVTTIHVEDLVNSYVINSFLGGPCQECTDTPGTTTTRTAIGFEATAPVSNQNTTLRFEGTYLTGWQYGAIITGGYRISFISDTVLENNWIGVRGIGGSSLVGSFGWTFDNIYAERNKYTGSGGCGAAFMGDPADPTNSSKAVAPRTVHITKRNTYTTNYDFICGPKTLAQEKTNDVSTGATDFDFITEAANGAEFSPGPSRTVASALPIWSVLCGNPDVTKPCDEAHHITSQQSGQPSKSSQYWESRDSSGTTWYSRTRYEGGIEYVETVDSLTSPTTYHLTHYPNSTGVDTTIGSNVTVGGDFISHAANGKEVRMGAGLTGVPGIGTLTNDSLNFIANGVAKGLMDTTGNMSMTSYYVLGSQAIDSSRNWVGVGFSGTKVAGSCTLTIAHGIITNVTGC